MLIKVIDDHQQWLIMMDCDLFCDETMVNDNQFRLMLVVNDDEW